MDTNQNTGFTSGVAGAPPQERSPEGWQSTGQAKQTISDKSREAKTQIKQGAKQAAETLKRKGSETAHQLQDQSKDFVRSRKHDLAGKITGCGAAVRRAADKLRDEQDPNIAHYADMVAERFESVGNYIESQDVNAMFRDVENFARRRPEIVLGGMFVVGLALSRFLKASNERETYEYETDEDYWVEDYDTGEEEMMSGTGSDMSLTGPVTPSPVAPSGTPSSGTMGSGSTPGPVI